jgi:serine/threonine protein kinase
MTLSASDAPRNDALCPGSALAEPAAASRKWGRYVVLGTLGRGGMGTVLEAFDPTLDRQVAVKVLHDDVHRHTARLLREAQAMAMLSHPNVVHVYEVGELDGRAYMVMELVEGMTLRAWMEQAPSWRECVKVFVELGAGLAAAHVRGLVHRDFKPSNAIIGDDGRPRVLDFGLVRHTLAPETHDDGPTRGEPDHAVAPTATLTSMGSVLGTLAYMPPEQMNGLGADARSDQFSFCVSLYEAVYGERPFEGRTMAELRTAMTTKGVRPPPKGVRVPLALRKVLLRGLSAEPERRWPSMAALLVELGELVTPRSARPRWLALWLAVGLAMLGSAVERSLPDTGARDARRRELEAVMARAELATANARVQALRARLEARTSGGMSLEGSLQAGPPAEVRVASP